MFKLPFLEQSSPGDKILLLKKYIHLIFFSCWSHSTQQFHQASEPVLHLHQHMANSRWIHSSGKCVLERELGLNICSYFGTFPYNYQFQSKAWFEENKIQQDH